MPTTKPKIKPDAPWECFLVRNADNVVLGIFGSALETEAQAQAATIRQHHPWAAISVVRRKLPTRPKIGQVIP